MKEQQIIQVKRSWRIIRQIDPRLLGGVFYEKLFTDQPALRRLFKTSIDDQSQKLIDMLSLIVMNVDQLDDFTTEIEALALRHVDYGVRPEHYEAVGSALLWTFQQGLGTDWSSAMEEAWSTCYRHVATTMIRATQPA